MLYKPNLIVSCDGHVDDVTLTGNYKPTNYAHLLSHAQTQP